MAKVPTMLPTVPAAEMRPTVLPVRARSRTASLTTIGETVPKTTLGRKKSAAVKMTMRTTIGQLSGRPRPSESTARMPALKTPASRKSSPNSRVEAQRSASQPPRKLPRLIPASTTPMTLVQVYSETPT